MLDVVFVSLSKCYTYVGKGGCLQCVGRMDVGDGIAAVNNPYKLTKTSVFFCSCVDLDFYGLKADLSSSKMAFVSAQGPTVVDQTTLMKKYLQFVAALTDVNTRERLFSN